MVKKMNVESFNLDHTKVAAPYIRLAGTTQGASGDVIHKYDIRFCQPNKEHMEMPGLHSLEHLMAENIRNHKLPNICKCYLIWFPPSLGIPNECPKVRESNISE